MSTKIYNGFRMRKEGITRLHALMTQLRATCAPIAKQGLLRYAATHMAHLADHRLLNPEEPQKGSVRGFVTSELMDRLHKLQVEPLRDPSIDFTFEIVLIPVGNYLLGIPFAEHRVFMDELFKLPGVEEYGYWNNTDKPEHVTDAQWRKRAKDWDKALPGCDSPAASGFTYQITRPAPFFPYTAYTPDLFPSFDERLKDAAIAELMKRKIGDSGAPLSAYVNMRRWAMNDPEGIAYLAEITEELRPKLPLAYTIQDLGSKKETSNEADS